jgi:hypothetical protein
LGGTAATTIAGLTSVSSTGFTGALTGNASTATTLATARTINGTSFNGSADITIPNLVSGSSQIFAGSTTNFATDVKTRLNSNTVVSGSGQVIHTDTSGYVADEHINHDTVNMVAGAGLNGGGNLRQTRTFNVTAGSHITVAPQNVAGGVAVNTTTLIPAISGTILSSITGDVTITAGGVATIGANSVALGTDTTGNYVASMTAGTGITVGTATGEGSTPVITNTGVTSIVAGLGITVSGATGAVTMSIGQSVATSANVQFATVDTGQGATEVHLMNQNVRTTDSVTFAGITTTSDITVNGLTIGRGSGNVEGNTVVGQGAGQSNIGGYWNSFFGERAGNANTSGYGNSFFGTQAGLLNQTGEYNTYIGHVAGYQIMGSNNTIIGVAQGTAGLSGTIIIAAGTTERIRVNSVGVMSVVGSATFTGDVTANTSDKRLKDNIRVIDNPLEKLSKINGVYFNWNDTAKDLIHKSDDIEEVGFLAQEVQSVLPHIVKPAPFDIDVLTGESKSGENYLTIQYEKIVPLLVEAIKELKKQVDELKNK